MKPRINEINDEFLLGPPYITADELEGVKRVLKSGQLSLGEELNKFEEEMAKFVGAKYAVACSSGTAALHLAVLACGIKEGDEVITSPLSFVASTNCFLYEKAVPKFVDIDPETLNIDVTKIEKQITKKTKAIVGVDIFGYPAEWQEILRIANKYKLKVIEDAAEALGALYQGKKLGGMGHLTVFAFYPNKQMTTGEGGVVTMNDKRTYQLIKGLANQGRGPKMQWLKHDYLGFNYRLSELQAVIGRTQLSKLPEFIINRDQVASWYKQNLESLEGVSLMLNNDRDHKRSWFVYLIKLDKRFNQDKVIEQLQAKGIPSKAYLPAIHLQPYMQEYGYKKGDLPICEAVAEATLALPFYTGMKESTVIKVCQQLKEILK
jgi:perosamine synthetase